MVVRKILESTLAAGASSVTFTDTDIPNSLLRVYCTKSGLFPISQTLSGNSVSVNYKPQDVNIGVALEIVKSGLDIVDDLVTDDSSKALSANQGYVLKGLIDGIVIPEVPENITDLNDVSVSSVQNGQVLAWNSTTEKFENVNQSGGGSLHVYSTDEQVVGKWTDNSDVFEQTFNIDISSTFTAGINDIIYKPNIILLDYEGAIYSTSNKRSYPLPIAIGSATTMITYNLNANDYINLRINNDQWSSVYKIALTIRFLKTA